jgi:hypothetical protein
MSVEWSFGDRARPGQSQRLREVQPTATKAVACKKQTKRSWPSRFGCTRKSGSRWNDGRSMRGCRQKVEQRSYQLSTPARILSALQHEEETSFGLCLRVTGKWEAKRASCRQRAGREQKNQRAGATTRPSGPAS